MRIQDRILHGVTTGVLLIPLAFLTGCGRDLPVSPPPLTGDSFSASRASMAPSSGRDFFPLAIGNRWHALSEDRATLIPSDGSPSTAQYAVHTDISREMTGTEVLSGNTYTLMREIHVSTSTANPNPTTYTTWVRYRQDAAGLYEADVTGPPASASKLAPAVHGGALSAALPASLRSRVPVAQAAAYERAWSRLQEKIASLREVSATPTRASDVMDGEITRLDYPLHPHAEWTIRAEPFFRSVVEGLDHLQLAGGRFSAYRIRIENEFLGENDSVHLWMGKSGQLQLTYHVESVATDEDGNEIGRIVAEHQEAVDSLSLVRP